MKITAYNHHARLLSSRASWSFSRNQFTQVEGADAVMQSFIHSSIEDEWETAALNPARWLCAVHRVLSNERSLR